MHSAASTNAPNGHQIALYGPQLVERERPFRMALLKSAIATKDLQTKVREFILQKFPLARKHQLKNSDSLLETGMLDSMGVLEIVTFIEEEYGVTVCDDDLVPQNFQAIDHIVSFIQNKIPQ